MRKNILFITADQFRNDALGLHDVFPVKTPNLDQLAATGCLMENAYCASPLCGPSRTSIMTGQYCHQHGNYYNSQPWPRTKPTLPGLFSENGCRTVKVGKTHFYPKHFHGGFDKVVGSFDLRHRVNGQSAERFQPGWAGMLELSYGVKKVPPSYETLEPVVFTEVAMEEIGKMLNTRECRGIGANEPFFMWLSYMQPHSPCNPPEPYCSMYPPETIREAIKSLEEIKHFSPPLRRFMKYWETIDDATRRSFISRYLGSITLLDEQIGKLMEFLKKSGLQENTLIVFSSDHGDYLGDHHCMQKAFFHDCSSKVPLIFNGPGVSPGQRVQQNVSLVDLLPTLLDYANLWVPDRRDPNGNPIYDTGIEVGGMSLMPLLRDEADASANFSRRVVISESGIHGQSVMLKQGQTKINYYPQSGHWDHFETGGDPDELNNLANKDQPPHLSPEMQETLDCVLQSSARLKDRFYFYDGKTRPMFS